MARQEHDREDLLRDGKQMPLRAECRIEDVVVVIGFRDRGQVSMYFGADPVFQFNENRQLRRVFFEGKRFAAACGKLYELTRRKQDDKLQFLSTEIDEDAESVILKNLDQRLVQLQAALKMPGSHWKIVGDKPMDFLPLLSAWLKAVSASLVVADAANA